MRTRGRLLAWAIALAALALLTWPVGLGQLTARVVCRPSEIGLKINRQVEASNTGYYLSGVTLEGSRYNSGFDPTRQAAWDLLNGRIAFFELDSDTPGHFRRFMFAPGSSAACVANSGSAFAGLIPPKDQCLASVEVESLQSFYQLDGANDRIRRTVELRVRGTRELVATFVTHRVPYMRMGNIHSTNTSTDLECPAVKYNPALGDGLLYFSPERALTAFVMRDRDGKVIDLAALERGDEDQFYALPSRTEPSQAGSCTLPELPANAELHRFWREKPAMRVARRLHEYEHEREVLEVQVDRPGVPVVLLLQSRWAIRWKIIEGEGTKIAALLVSAENGALSIEESTTQYYGIPKLVYSPVMGKTANCNRELFARAVESLAKVPSMADVAGAASPEGAWTLSGEPIVIKEARTPEERGEPLPPPPAPPHDPDRLLTVSELLEQGYMRKVTEKDIRFFLRERRPNMRKYDGMVRMLTFDTYTDVIVLRDMTLPVNQQKARDLRYIVPRGVPEPSFAVPGFQIAFVDAECDAQGCRP